MTPSVRRALAAGGATLPALVDGYRGHVLASFDRALYLRSADGVVALVDPGVQLGPVHLRLDGPPPHARPGMSAVTAGGVLRVAGTEVRLGDTRVWRGRLPHPRAARAIPVSALHRGSQGSALCHQPWNQQLARARRRLEVGDLAAVLALLGGLGPGLTPAGDDAASGLLFGLRATRGSSAQPILDAATRAAITGPISRAFLTWAARGQTLAPAHELLSLLSKNPATPVDDPLKRILAVGHTSGADFLLGMVLAFEASALRGDSVREAAAERKATSPAACLPTPAA